MINSVFQLGYKLCPHSQNVYSLFNIIYKRWQHLLCLLYINKMRMWLLLPFMAVFLPGVWKHPCLLGTPHRLRFLPIVNVLFVHWQSWQLVCLTSGQLAVAIRLKGWYFNEFSSQTQNCVFENTCLLRYMSTVANKKLREELPFLT